MNNPKVIDAFRNLVAVITATEGQQMSVMVVAVQADGGCPQTLSNMNKEEQDGLLQFMVKNISRAEGGHVEGTSLQ
jgi:hypothetical protein